MKEKVPFPLESSEAQIKVPKRRQLNLFKKQKKVYKKDEL